ncbi:MAG: EamA family transporter [Sedimentibacter sp.]
MWNYFWPILLVVAFNVSYHICSKSTPQNIQPFAALMVTYFVSLVVTVILYFFTSETKSLVGDLKNLNWTSFVLGISIVGLEVGFIQMYRAGWNISIGSLVANIALAVVLIVVGLLVYHDNISVNQTIGIVLCIAGLLFINI